jgi:hypothetical protein
MTGDHTVSRGWHRGRAAQERRLADLATDAAVRDRHRHLAAMHEHAIDAGYQLQAVEDR